MTNMRLNEWSGRGRTAPWIGALALALVALGACNGDTLYEAPPANISPPDLQLQVTGLGSEILAGKSVRVRAEATDSLGVSDIEIEYEGVSDGVIRKHFDPPLVDAVLDTVIATPPGVSGSLEITGRATNAFQAMATTAPARVIVSSTDRFAPTVALESVVLPARMEIDDSLFVSVTAADNPGGSGLVNVGLAIVVASSARTDTLVFEQAINIPTPLEGGARGTFYLLPPFASPQAIPENLSLEFHAFAVDSAGNCAAAIDATPQQLACAQRSYASGSHTVADTTAQIRSTVVVAGRSVPLASGADIADAVADVARQRLYLSNRASGHIEVLEIPTRVFSQTVRVGSEPWGVALNRGKDTLIVANSGGTSISFVSLNGTPAEAWRFNTLNTPLFEIDTPTKQDSLGAVLIDFNDRPQFLAQDAAGRVLYSTRSTTSRPAGTLRIVVHQPGWVQPEVRLLRGPDAVNPLPDTIPPSIIAVANVDSVRRDARVDTLVEIFDHENGDPTRVIRSGMLLPDSAVRVMERNPLSDIYWRYGNWNLDDLQFQDTTFVSASANHNRIVFGEGSHPTGRIILWKSDSSDVSNEITVADLVGNGSEHILDVQLNNDGTLGLARGMYGAYTFKRDLRLQGFYRPFSAAGRSGAVLHPDHPSTPTYDALPASDPTTVAFTDDGNEIRIFDTTHYVSRGLIPIRDEIVGPLRVSPPLAGDLGSCPGPDCVVAKLYGVTDAGTVVIVDVRERDIK